MLPACAETKIEDSKPASINAKRDAYHADAEQRRDEWRQRLEQIRDTIDHSTIDKIIFISSKEKSFSEQSQKSLEGSDIYFYQVEKVLNDAQRQEFFSIIHDKLEVPKYLESPLNVRISISSNHPYFTTEFRFYKNGELLETLNFERIGGKAQNRLCDCAADYVHKPVRAFYYRLNKGSYLKLENFVKELNQLYRADEK